MESESHLWVCAHLSDWQIFGNHGHCVQFYKASQLFGNCKWLVMWMPMCPTETKLFVCLTVSLTWLLVLVVLQWPPVRQAYICQTLHLLRNRNELYISICTNIPQRKKGVGTIIQTRTLMLCPSELSYKRRKRHHSLFTLSLMQSASDRESSGTSSGSYRIPDSRSLTISRIHSFTTAGLNLEDFTVSNKAGSYLQPVSTGHSAHNSSYI